MQRNEVLRAKTLIWLMLSCLVPLAFLLIAKSVFDVSQAEINTWLAGLSESNWAVPVTILLYCGLAFVAAPQWMLVTATILAFGTLGGSFLAWFASLCSASTGFYLGRVLGADRLSHVDDRLVQRLSNAIRRNGFVTSLVVRLVPTGPAILVNLAAGVSRMKFLYFLTGTAVGIIPKILIIALISQGLISGLSGSYMGIGFAILAAIAIAVSWMAKRRLEARVLAETKKTQ